jgi:hypothetical protein
MTQRETTPLTLSLSRLSITAVTCLCCFVILALAVAHSRGPYGFEETVSTWLGAPSSAATWANLAELLTTPVIAAVLVISVTFGIAKRALFRVVVYGGLATTAFLLSEHVAKPLIDRSYFGELTFPSGSVTAVSATVLAMCLAFYPLLGKRERVGMLVIGGTWTFVTALAVVGALWHTPLDDVGSILLSTGVVTGGSALFETAAARGAKTGAGRPKIG